MIRAIMSVTVCICCMDWPTWCDDHTLRHSPPSTPLKPLKPFLNPKRGGVGALFGSQAADRARRPAGQAFAEIMASKDDQIPMWQL